MRNPDIPEHFSNSDNFSERSELNRKSKNISGKPCENGKGPGLPGTPEQPFSEDAPHFHSPHPHILEPMLCTVRNSFAAQLN